MKAATGRSRRAKAGEPLWRAVGGTVASAHDPSSAPAGHPGKSRIGEGVAEEALHECAGNRKRRANHYAREQAAAAGYG